MAATIKIKNSSTAGAAPTSSDLVQGELAVNVTDKRLYTENSSGTVVELGTNPSVPVTFPDGSASAPSLTNDGDTNTGVFFPAADTVGITTGGTERARIDSSGNLGLGVTPSAWTVFSPVLQIKTSSGAAALTGNANDNIRLFNNAYYDGAYKRIGAGYASYYEQDAGKHAWHYAGTSTAGSTITFTQAMTLDASGNLGVGTTSPVNKIHVVGSATTNVFRAQASSSGDGIVLRPNAAGNGGDVFSVNSAQDTYTPLNLYGSRIVFGANGTESARIDSSGNLLVGKTSDSNTSTGISLRGVGEARFSVAGTGTNTTLAFFRNGSSSESGRIDTTTTTTSYVTTSDYRLKENVQPMTGALGRVAALKPVTYKWKIDGSDGEGFIAHELQEVCPQAVTGEKDAVNEDGSIKTQGIDTSFLVATLTAALQEMKAIVDAQAARITALEQA